MPEENKEQTNEEIEAELAALGAELLKDETPAAAEVPAETPAETTAETPAGGSDFNDMVPAVKTALANMTPEKRAEALADWQKAVEAKQEESEQKVAKGAVRQTAAQMLEGIRAGVPDELLPEDFDDLEPHEQLSLLNYLQTELKADAKAKAAIAPYEQEKAQQAHLAMLHKQSEIWATDNGKPEAAEDIYNFIGSFPPEYVELYKQEMTKGGGPISYMVSKEVLRIIAEKNKVDEKLTEKPLPKSEDVGGTVDEGPTLSKEAQSMYDEGVKLGLDKDQLASMKKELAGIK